MSGSKCVALLVCVGLLGCPQTASPSDSTSSAASAGSSGGQGSTGGNSSGGSTSAGTTSAGTTGSLVFSEQALPSDSGNVKGLFGRSASDVWAVTDNGWVLHASGATWTRVFSTPNGNGLQTVYEGSDGKVWVGGADGFFTCSDHCTDADAAPFSQADFGGQRCDGLESICGHDAQVYVLCDLQNAGTLFASASQGAWTSQALDGSVFDRCVALPDGQVLVSAQSQIYRLDPSLGLGADAIQFPAGTRPEYAYFSALWGDGAHEFASTNGGRIYGWSASDKAWKPVLRATAISAYADDGFKVFVGTDSSADVFALGEASDDHPASRWDGSTWSDLSNFGGGNYSFFSGWAAAPDDFWAGGVRRSTNDGFIVHVHR